MYSWRIVASQLKGTAVAVSDAYLHRRRRRIECVSRLASGSKQPQLVGVFGEGQYFRSKAHSECWSTFGRTSAHCWLADGREDQLVLAARGYATQGGAGNGP